MKKLGLLIMPLMAISLLANCGGKAPVEHFVTFESYGGDHIPTQRVKDGGTAINPGESAREGYDFKGWYTVNPDPTPIEDYRYDFATKVTSDITLYAGWKPKDVNRYDFSLNGTGCTIFNDSQYKEEGIEEGSSRKYTIVPSSKYELPLTVTIDEGSGCAVYDDNGTITITNMNSDVKVTAKATPIETTYTITFNANGGELDRDKGAVETITGIAPREMWKDKVNKEIQTATKTNHNFMGWGLSEHTPDVIDDEFTITKDFTAYAIYAPKATATIKLADNSENCKLYYGGSCYDISIPFVVPANENLVLTVEPNKDYLPVFKDELTFTGEGGSTGVFNPAKKEITVNLKPNSNNTIYASTTSPLKAKLEAYSWKEIKAISEGGVASLVFKVGEDKTVMLNNQPHKVRIIGFNHDYSELLDDGSDPDPSKLLGITFEFANLITDSNGKVVETIWDGEYGVSGNNYDYRKSVLNTFLNNDVLNMLPSDPSNPDLREVIKQVDKKVGVNESQTAGSQYYTATSFDGTTYPYPYLFPLAYDEITKTSGEKVTEGTIYQYYEIHDTDDDRIKKGVDASSAETYWLRSPYTDSSYVAWRVIRSGAPNCEYFQLYNYKFAVAPAFCI